MQITALFKKAGAAPKKAAAKSSGKKTVKSAPAPRKAGGKSTGGWLGTGSQDLGLDKYVDAYRARDRVPFGIFDGEHSDPVFAPRKRVRCPLPLQRRLGEG
jgi:hypothetical protein